MLFDSYFTFESRFRWHRLIITVESTRGIRTLVVVFESLEEMFAWECRNDLPARFISATLHVDKSFKMAAKLGDCRKLDTTQFAHSYDQGRFLLRWTFHDQNDTITFHIRVKTTGWVGFGFADNAPNNMQGYDVIVGGFDNGQGYLNDYYTRGQTIPGLDNNQNYQLVYASEIGEYTELMFQRPRDTNDNDDIQFEVAEEKHIIWAYGTDDIRNPSVFDRHAASGVGNMQLVIVDKQPVPTQAAVSSLHSCINAILIAAAIVFSNVLGM